MLLFPPLHETVLSILGGKIDLAVTIPAHLPPGLAALEWRALRRPELLSDSLLLRYPRKFDSNQLDA